MINQTELATDHINQKSDAEANSMTLSGQGANIDLDNDYNDYHENQKYGEEALTGKYNPEDNKSYLDDYLKSKEEKPEEKKYTQGEYQTQINEVNRQIENYNNWLDWLHENKSQDPAKMFLKLGTKSYLEFINTMGISPEEHKIMHKEKGNEQYNYFINELNNKLSKEYQKKEDIMYNSDYDPRDYGERRKDTETQRKVKDYEAAGLNQAAVSGFYGGGGGGSGGGSAKDEDDERKKRRKAREAAKAREEAKKQRNIDRALNVLSTVANTGGRLGGSLIMGNAWGKRADSQIESSNITAQNRLDVEHLRNKLKRQRIADDEPAYLDEIMKSMK